MLAVVGEEVGEVEEGVEVQKKMKKVVVVVVVVVEEQEKGKICKKLGKENGKDKKAKHGPTFELGVWLSGQHVLNYLDGEQC